MLPGLKLLLNYNRLTGSTFFGWTDNGESHSKQKILKIWNIILLVGLTCNCYIWIKLSMLNIQQIDDTKNVTLSSENNAQFDILHFMFSTSIIIYTIQALLVAIYQTVFGRQLMTLVAQDNQHMKSHLAKEYSIAKWIIILQVAFSLLLCTLSSIIDVAIYKSYAAMVMHFLNVIPDSVQTTIITLVAYKSLTVKQMFNNINELNNLDLTYSLVSRVNKSVKCLDKYVSVFNILFLLVNQIFCVSTLCQMSLNSHIRFFESLLIFVYGLMNIFILCYVCDIIPSSLDSLLDRLEIHLNDFNDRSIECYDTKKRQIMIQMRQMSDRIGFTAFGLFRINKNTLLSCLALIISYSVIIVQTGQTTAPLSYNMNCSLLNTNCNCNCT